MRSRILLVLATVFALAATAEANFRDRAQQRREARQHATCGSCQTATVPTQPPAHLPPIQQTAGYAAPVYQLPAASAPVTGCAGGTCQPAVRGAFRVR